MNAQSRQTDKLIAEVEKLRIRVAELEKQKSHDLEQLKSKEHEYRTVFENTGTATCILENDGTISLTNAKFSDLSGYSITDIQNKKKLMEFVTPEDLERMREQHELRRKNSEKALKEYEFMFIDKNHVVKNIHLKIDIIPGKDKSVASLLDISDRIGRDKELTEQEKFIKTVMDNLPVGIAVNYVSPSVEFLYMNDNFLRIYRTTREELSSADRFWDAVYEDPVFRAGIKKRVLRDIASGDPGRMSWDNIPIARKGEGTSYINAYNTPVHERGLMISTVIDVTEQKLAETALRDSEARFRMLAESAPLGIIISDKNQKTVYASRRFTEIFGYTIEDMPSIEHWWPLAYPDEKERTLIKEKWNKAIVQSQDNPSGINPMEFSVRCKDGTFRQVEFRLASNNGFYYVILTDMTERKKAEEELRKLKNNLEALAEKQNRELKEKVSELERFRAATIDREFRIKELRDEVERLKGETGEME